MRYQRGPRAQGRYYLKMRADIHAEAGMGCADCHSMASLVRGDKSSATCRTCHEPDKRIIEHSIAAHLKQMECSACHAAWAAQEYGTFYIRSENSSNSEYFRVADKKNNYIRSAYMRRQDAPPLGLNASGKVAPLRPQFIAYYSAMRDNRPQGEENRLLLAQWKAFAPHTIRRAVPMCDSCHANRRRFLLQPLDKRRLRPDLDGLHLESFWRQQGQQVVNGSFYPAARWQRLHSKTPLYRRKYVEKWREFLKTDAPSCAY